MSPQNQSALIGFLFALPFVILNFIVALRFEPFYSFLGSFPALRNSPWLPLVLLLLLPIGAYFAARPLFQKNSEGKRRVYLLNVLLVALLLVAFALLSYGLGGDFYQCEVLRIPNCD